MRFFSSPIKVFYLSLCLFLCLAQVAGAQVFRGYYPNGGVKFVMKTKRNRYVIRGYYPSGALEFIAFYRKDELDGITREYYEDGILKAEIPYRENRRHGLAKFYYPNGILMGKITYKRGKETGEAKFYDKNGFLTSSTPRIRKQTRRSKPYEDWADRRVDSLRNAEKQ
jgi:antitoxin component YwqK of YwqJK toxin-antitoxin module